MQLRLRDQLFIHDWIIRLNRTHLGPNTGSALESKEVGTHRKQCFRTILITLCFSLQVVCEDSAECHRTWRPSHHWRPD